MEHSSADSEELEVVNLYLKHDSNTDYFMNSVMENPDDDNGITELVWEYGWWDGENVIDTELLTDLYIEGTFGGGGRGAGGSERHLPSFYGVN